MTLAEFYAARLDEDEHIARMATEDASASANWHVEARYPGSGSAGIAGGNGEKIVSDEGFPGQMEAEHIARHDPARVLRDIEAKRAILAMHRPVRDDGSLVYPEAAKYCAFCGPGDNWRVKAEPEGMEFARFPCAHLRHLAAVYNDHPDYDPAWRPE